ncbi:hypothetical protein Pelo_8896 [Pelomyxa schiedti]|nr:hypothetical protein Pelo_8896 [Pelomyxa schiedti]
MRGVGHAALNVKFGLNVRAKSKKSSCLNRTYSLTLALEGSTDPGGRSRTLTVSWISLKITFDGNTKLAQTTTRAKGDGQVAHALSEVLLMVSSAISETTLDDEVYHTSHTETAVATTRPTDTSTDRSTPLSVARATALAILRGFLPSLPPHHVFAAAAPVGWLDPRSQMVADCGRPGGRLHVEFDTETSKSLDFDLEAPRRDLSWGSGDPLGVVAEFVVVAAVVILSLEQPIDPCQQWLVYFFDIQDLSCWSVESSKYTKSAFQRSQEIISPKSGTRTLN